MLENEHYICELKGVFIMKAVSELKSMHYLMRSMLPTSYFIYCFVGCIDYVLFVYGFTASDKPGSFLTCLIGFGCYLIAGWLYSKYLVATDWKSTKLHNIALVGHLVVLAMIVSYLFF